MEQELAFEARTGSWEYLDLSPLDICREALHLLVIPILNG